MPDSPLIQSILDQLEAKRLDLIEDALMTMPDTFRNEYKEVVDAIKRLKGEEEVIAQMPPAPKPAATAATAPKGRKRSPAQNRGPGFNSQNVAKRNREAVVAFLRENPNSTPIEIVNGANVKRGSITSIMQNGVKENIFTQADRTDGGRGHVYSLAGPVADEEPIPTSSLLEASVSGPAEAS